MARLLGRQHPASTIHPSLQRVVVTAEKLHRNAYGLQVATPVAEKLRRSLRLARSDAMVEGLKVALNNSASCAERIRGRSDVGA